jgi:hypothetical protein
VPILNPETIDSEYSKLEQAVNDTGSAIEAFAQKLQAAAASDPNAKEWLLDLKSIALQVQQDHLQMQSFMQAVHDFTVSHLSEQAQPQQVVQQPVYAPQPGYGYQQPMGGSTFGRFFGGTFGRAMAMGAGFGLGDDLINAIL